MQLTQLPAEERKQALKEMEMTDPVLHALVQKLIRSIFSAQQSQGVGTAGLAQGTNMNGTPAGGAASGSGPAVAST